MHARTERSPAIVIQNLDASWEVPLFLVSLVYFSLSVLHGRKEGMDGGRDSSRGVQDVWTENERHWPTSPQEAEKAFYFTSRRFLFSRPTLRGAYFVGKGVKNTTCLAA